MAPELLSSNAKSYTNKADLWSIGIVLYQMIVGRAPFSASSFDVLKYNVRNYSGKNLRFPSNIQISEHCKKLLRSLIEHDPKKRIEWV